MAVDLQAVFRRGGRELVSLLDFCVCSVQMDPLFLFLVHEFRLEPSAAKALAMYDLFCAPQALARLKTYEVLPPRNLRIAQAIEMLRRQHALADQCPQQTGAGLEELWPVVPSTPGNFLFDSLAEAIWRGESVSAVARNYNPLLDVKDNLPGGQMTQAQRVFVDSTWQPRVRPQLAAAGFRRIATIG